MNIITEIKRDSFVFYRSFFDVIKLLNSDQAKALMIAIGEYALDGTEPNLSENTLKVAWLPIKPQLEANRRRYENGCKGGAPKGSKNNPRGRKGKETTISTNNASELTVDNIDVPDLVKITPAQPAQLYTSKSTQQIPTQAEVKEFVQVEKLKIDPVEFYLYYESHNWMSGANPLYNWQAMARKWSFKASKEEEKENSPLGVGEFIDNNGNRTYGESGVIVPMNAPRRPSEGHWWNTASVQWEKYA